MKKISSTKGIGLLEIMLVLAVISLMLVSVIRYFSIVNRTNRVGQAITMVNAIRAAGERWKATHGDYKTLTVGTELQDLVNRGLLPDIYGLSNVKNPWGGNVSANKGTDSTQLDIKFLGIPSPDCTNFVKMIKKTGCTPTPTDACTSATTDVVATC